MAKLSVAVLFLLLTLALTPSTLSENDATHLQLPSEIDGIRPEDPNILPEFGDSSPILTLPTNSVDEETRSVHPIPFTLVKFHPINRRFRIRSNLPFRLCRHYFHHRNPVLRHQIRYGNDMIVSSSKNIDLDKFVYRIGVREIPADRVNFPHYHLNDEVGDHKEKISKLLDDREKFGKIKLKRQNQFRVRRFVDFDDNEADKRSKLYAKHSDRMKLRKRFHYRDAEKEEEEVEKAKWHKRGKKKGGFMRSIRKFLHHYFD